MSKYYRPLLLLYGGVHVAAGAALWVLPSATGLFLYEPLPASASTLLGFLSILAGLGFAGAAGATRRSSQRSALVACMAGNVLNLAAHGQNVAAGYSPPALGWVAGLSVAVMVAVLAGIYRAVGRQPV